ncbi:hypothetical protein [Adhaeribacter radiodurans]|uniref:Uncharacterized protein n=1 Tax=Adhaeribacter radiodurans TaxID=2745197 RepID=A0A7L7LBA0_9BACT|nr:hypothetical protein [Adhaeribacter radiodurans]QMU30118.1 hypothetical protein HUW48_19725 [Adhaeribacter radiodurans]
METADRKEILTLVNQAHSLVEKLYLQDPTAKGSAEWLNKRRLLLADLSLHLVQASVSGEKMRPELLKRYLYSVLTIAQDFLPEIDLSHTAEQLMTDETNQVLEMPN